MNVVNFGVLKLACGHSDTLTIEWVYYVVAERNVIMHHTILLTMGACQEEQHCNPLCKRSMLFCLKIGSKLNYLYSLHACVR